MTKPFSYSTKYTLDKSHFSETFDESTTLKVGLNAYLKSIAFVLLGLAILYLTQISPYGAWFLIGLGFLEALSTRFKKPWWLTRQMLSKAANTELTLTIDEHGVSSKSFYVDSKISWDDIGKIEKTAQGWLLYHNAGKNYVSTRCLSDAASEFVNTQALLKPA
jgi:hypothetical protein